MKYLINYLREVLDNKEKSSFLIVLLGTFLVGLLETISIGSLVGYLVVISDPAKLISNINFDILKNYLSSLSHNRLIIVSSFTLVFIFIFKNIIQIFFYYLEINFIKKLQIKFSRNILNIFLNKPYIFHVNQNSSSSINTIMHETKRSSDYINNILMITREIIILLFLIILLMIVNIKLSLILSLIMIISSIIFYLSISKKIKILGSKVREKSEKILKNLSETILSIKIIKLLNKNQYFINILDDEMNQKKKIEITHNIIGRIPKFFLEILSVLIIIFILLFFVYQGRSIQEALPILSLIVLIIIRTMPAYISINTNLNNTKFNSIAFKNTCLAIIESNQLNDKTVFNPDLNQKPSIKVSNLKYSYENKLVLDDISYEFKSGKIYGIKGESGSGKTTLLNLILGLLEPNIGEIYVNNKKLNVNMKLPNNLFNYVPQDIYLLDTSVSQNIAIGIEEKDIDYKYINQIIDILELREFIKNLPGGLQSFVGDKGIKISGGQKQRIGIARALYAKPKIMIFDEATNAMDSELEEKIILRLNSFKENNLIIFVSHNDELLNNCDEKIKIHNGKLIKF